MAVSAERQLQFWGIGFAVFVLVLWLLGATLLPFLLGAALAYFLDPVADRLERLGLSRVAGDQRDRASPRCWSSCVILLARRCRR